MRKLFLFLMLGLLSTASAQTTVTGRVTGADGKPMLKTRISLTMPNSSRVRESVIANRRGNFRIHIPYDGVWLLTFNGVFHKEYRVAVYTDSSRKIGLDVHLATLDYLKRYRKIKIVGDFNKWYDPDGIPMKKQADGLYTAFVKTKMKSIRYQLTGVMGSGNLAGTDAYAFAYDGSHGFTSMLRTRRGGVKVTFDPSRLPSGHGPSGYRFVTSTRVTSRFAQIYDQMQTWRKEHAAALMRAMEHAVTRHKKSSAINFGFKKALADIDSQIVSEKSPVIREVLYFDYFRIASLAGPANSSLARRTLEKVPYSSPAWILEPQVFNACLQASGFGRLQRHEQVDKLLKENRWAAVKARVLSVEFMHAKYFNQKRAARQYYRMLTTDYPNTEAAKETKRNFPHELLLQIGARVPDFSVVSLENSVQIISRQNMKGKYYVVYFWKSGDKSCESETEALQKAYKKFAGKNFDILSMSLDKDYATTLKTLGGKYKMPWLNAYLGPSAQSKVASDFEVTAVPSVYLVDPRGVLVEEGKDLIGRNLETTLAKYLGKKPEKSKTSG